MYRLFLLTDKAETIWKVCHCALHTAIVGTVIMIAQNYFKRQVWRAQLVAFALVSNGFVHWRHLDLFNDSILAFYAVLSIWLMTRDKPLHSAVAAGLAVSIKAGALLLLPSILGWTHYFYGTKRLLQVFAAYVGL